MKKTFIVANWKSNKTEIEANSWLEEISKFRFEISNKEIIICPPFTFLLELKNGIKDKNLEFKLGGQNISQFDEGPYTGEMSAKQIKEFAEYVLVGHSERRKNFFETDEIVNAKIVQAFKNELTPIICVSNLEQAQAILNSVKGKTGFIVAYEPIFAIGSGTADTPENADKMAKNIKSILGNVFVLYGGSVTPVNINGFAKMSSIDGVLIGRASLDAKEFYEIIQNT